MSRYEREKPADPDFQLKVEIDDEVYQKIMHWINKSDNEVSGLGKVVYDAQRGVLRVISAILLDQENTPGTTEIDAAAISKAMYELRDTEGTLNWWWHSHVNMDVFWSGTDHTAIRTLGQHGWFLSTVFNKRREKLSCYYQSGPIKIFADRLETTIVRQFETEKLKAWDQEYSDKVKTKTYGNYGGGNFGSYGSWAGHGGRWGGGENHSNRRELPRGQSHFPKRGNAGFQHYGMDFDDDDLGVPDYTSRSHRSEDKSLEKVPSPEDELKLELQLWDCELDDLIEANKFPDFPKKNKTKKKGA